MKRFFLTVIVANFILITGTAFGQMAPTDLAGIWRRNSDPRQFVQITKDLNWQAQLIFDEEIVKISGKAVMTTKGFDNRGTMVIFLYKAGDESKANVAFVLGSKDTTPNAKTTLSYDDLILIRK